MLQTVETKDESMPSFFFLIYIHASVFTFRYFLQNFMFTSFLFPEQNHCSSLEFDLFEVSK